MSVIIPRKVLKITIASTTLANTATSSATTVTTSNINNVSSLFEQSSKSDSRQGWRHFAPEPVLAKFERQENANSIFSKNAVRDFLTLEPTNTTTETRLGTLTLSAGIGNSHIDTAYAEYDMIEAARNLADAKKELNHMETLRKNNQADDEAVSDAKINLAMAAANLLLAELKLAAAAAKSAASASTLWTGFYGDLRLSIKGSKTNNSSSSNTAIASNINSNGNLLISSGLNLLNTNTDLMAGIVGNTMVTGSNLNSATGDITITSKNNTNITASKNTHNQATTNKSWNESVTLASSAGSGAGTAIDAAVNTAQASLGVGVSRSKSDTSSTSYNNSILAANNGAIKINSIGTTASGNQTGGDAAIKGANLLGQDIVLNTAGNLTVESLQNSYNNKSKSFGINLGGGTGASGGGSANLGVNYSSAKTDRLWTDNQTAILGTNSVTINTGNNTSIAGAVIANSTNGKIGANAIDGGNLTLNTRELTYANLYDHDYSQSNGFGISTSIGIGGGNNSSGAANNTTGQGTAPATNPNQQNNFYPGGSTTISAQNQGYKKEGTTFASVGQGNIKTGGAQSFDASGNLVTSTGGTTNDQTELAVLNRDITKSQIVTKDTITGALDVSVTIDNRLIAAAYEGLTDQKEKIQNDKTLTKKEKEQKIAALQSEILWKEQTNIGGNLATSTRAQGKLLQGVREVVENNLELVGTALTSPISAAEGAIFTFLEKKNDPEGSYLINKYGINTGLTLTKNYAVNGINTNEETAFNNYIRDPKNDVTLRYNPTHGAVGDLMESGFGKIFDWIGLENAIAMNRIVAEDLLDRKDIAGTNIFHSQGTIIGDGAMELYADKYMKPVLTYKAPDGSNTDWASAGGTQTLTYTNQINQNQGFVFVGPAESKNDLKSSVAGLNLNADVIDNKTNLNYAYAHNDKDPVLFLTTPRNAVNQTVKVITGKDINSPIYIPNLIVDIPLGIWNAAFHSDQHGVDDKNYSKYLSGNYKWGPQNSNNIPNQPNQ